jgi:protocatechuate 3,4-dioxygenase, beta subunit
MTWETEMRGRQLVPGPTDNSAALRTPAEPLWLIPPAARASFVPWLDCLPALRAGENDLSRLKPDSPVAEGRVITIGGRVSDRDGRPLRQTLVEIWNANRHGRYAHVDDPARAPLDPLFRGLGRVLTDADGGYVFRTIMPGSYLARPDIGRWRPAHVHFSVRGGSARLITQMYFAGDLYNVTDPGFILLGAAQPRHLVTDDGDGHFHFDIVMDGANASWFE